MRIKNFRLVKVSLTTLIGMSVWQSQTAKAGWTGLINGAGTGWASVNVRSVTLHTNKATTVTMSLPNASIAPTTGYLAASAPLPSGASLSDYARIKGLAGGIWQAQQFATVGDGTDNPELETRVIIKAANCASLTLDTSIDTNQFNANGHSGIITVNTHGTAGTALWLRGFEYTNDISLIPPDDTNTVQNESVEFLKTNGVWKFETLIVGPFDFGDGTCPLLIPFTLDSGDLNNLIFVVDSVAKSTPFSIACPSDVTTNCGAVVTFPPVQVTGGCGTITGTWSPPQNYAFPVGVTPVTVTAKDGNGDTATCGFNVIIVDTNAPVAPVLPDIIVGQCSGTPPTPVAIDSCVGAIQGTTTTKFPITTQGTNVVTWSFDDGHGNVTKANQNVIVKDTTPPVTPTLPDLLYGACNGVSVTPPAPTTTDNCKGTVTGTTTTSFPITNFGTTVLTWTFDDGNGNKTTANQNVIVSGLTFLGFYSPLSGTNGTCNNPLQTINLGSVIPIKFDIQCGSTLITGGTPPVVRIEAWSKQSCQFVSVPIVVNAVYQNNWHFNWDTTGWNKGLYRVVVLLPDGTSRYAYIQLR